MCGPRTFFRGFGFLFSLFFRFYHIFCFWIRMFPCATSIAKQPKKLQEKQKNIVKQKTQRFLRNVWAEDFRFQCCFGLTPVFCLGFWIWKLSSVTMIAKNQKHLTSEINAKIKKPKNPKDSQECLGPIFSLHFLFSALPLPKRNLSYLQIVSVSPMTLFFLLCSMFVSP